ncbi:MAG: glycosyltransferase, partial [Jatrophihabitans sp.]|uniref:glycosyltransferase n=1 Tax=Jatrophihabitans sp. TaxID=1932789 RepID=UPI003F812558
MDDRITVDGKFFARGTRRFAFRGVTYGTFAPREDGARFPDRDIMKADFALMREKGFTVVRTYTTPTDDLLDLAADWELSVLAGAFFPDWRYLVGDDRRERADVARQAVAAVRESARRLAGNPVVLGLSIGNEIPADVIRWHGVDRVTRALSRLVDVVRDEDPELLVTYGNYPTAEYLPLPELDFLTFNLFLERGADLRRYLTRLHHLAGDRPLVVGELGRDAGVVPADEPLTWDERFAVFADEQRQADLLDEQLAVALDRGVAGTCVFSWTDDWVVGDVRVDDWHFGLTRTDRSPRPALDVVARWNERTVRDLRTDWPTTSVVICAYNAEATLAECLEHTCALDHPDLEIIVVDDGSTDATAAIARGFPRVRLVQIPHAGLSAARNAGHRAARGEIVAYLDSDAYPSPEWPYYLALGLDASELAGVGGPNVPPPGDGPAAQLVARAPGGPVHVLTADDRAEHLPGCNMAFRRSVFDEVGGFDPVYTSAGDDVDFCWRVLDAGHGLGFHPAALVWHHRRSSLRAYLRQQRGYGRSEALVEARHPHRFNAAGSARWSGRIYHSLVPSGLRQRVYRGPFSAAPFQSGTPEPDHRLQLAHQVGVPLVVAVLPSAVLGLVTPALVLPAAAAVAFLVTLTVVDVLRAPVRGPAQRLRLAAHHLLQPLVRAAARVRHTRPARRAVGAP